MSVIELKTRKVEISETAIERLEQILERARAGEVSAVAIAFVNEDDSLNCCWSEMDNVGLLLGSIVRLQHRLCLRVDEENNR